MLSLALGLPAACAPTAPPRQLVETRLVKPAIDPALLDCAEAPAPPGPGATQRDVAAYVVALYGAGDDCRGKLAAVKQVLEAPSPP